MYFCNLVKFLLILKSSNLILFITLIGELMTNSGAIIERLKDVASATTDAELAINLKLSKQSIAQARSKNNIPPSWVYNASVRYQVSTDWLFFGRGAKYYAKQTNNADPNKSELGTQPLSALIVEDRRQCDVDLIMVPMVEARLSAGTGSLETSGEIERTYAFRSDFLHRKGNPDDMVLMRVGGDSMQPEIMDKDVVLLDQGKRDLRPGPIFAVGFEEAIYLKRIDMLPGKIILKSANPAYPPVEIQVGEQDEYAFRVIGQVIWSGREY